MASKKELKKQLIFDAALKVFAVKGYHYATVDDIAKEAQIAKGSIHAYFENKLDVLFTLILLFWQTINKRIDQIAQNHDNPILQLKDIMAHFHNIFFQNEKSLYWSSILKDGIPRIHYIKSEKLRSKQTAIEHERKKLIHAIDSLLEHAQDIGLIKNNIRYQAFRQMLGGASQLLVYGLFINCTQEEGIGYEKNDISNSINLLIDSFLSDQSNKGEAY